MTHSIKGRSAVVTGGSKGIGRGIAAVLAAAGAKVAILSRHGNEAAEVARMIGGGAIAVAADVTSVEAMARACAEVAERHGGIDVLCANAGIFPSATLDDMDAAHWGHVMDTNLTGTFNTVKAALPYLKQSTQGRIVLTSTITGPVTGYPGWTHYAASKAGQLGFMRSAALELAKHNITVNAVLPGNIWTEGLADAGEDYERTMRASIPLGRLGAVEDIGHAVLYFASKEAGFVTGQTLIIDGGQVLPESLQAMG